MLGLDFLTDELFSLKPISLMGLVEKAYGTLSINEETPDSLSSSFIIDIAFDLSNLTKDLYSRDEGAESLLFSIIHPRPVLLYNVSNCKWLLSAYSPFPVS